MIIWSNTLAKIARPIVTTYENKDYKIESTEESLDDLHKAVDEFCKLCNIYPYEEELEMDRDRYKCIAVYSTDRMYIYGLEEVESLLNEGWLIDETIEHNNFVMYIMHHFPVVDVE